MDVDQLRDSISNSAFAFRGYNVTNLGRSRELLRHPRYGKLLRHYLEAASSACTQITGRKTDLVSRVEHNRETTLRTYGDAIALIVATELAQLEMLETFFDISMSSAKLIYGYSLGEVTALIASGVFEMNEALRVPLSLVRDTVALAKDVTLGVLFSRGEELSLDEVIRQCLLVNLEGRGVVGVSAYLSPNSVLLMGQGDSMDRFRKRISEVTPFRVYLRKNQHHWPPLHTPIVWQKNLPTRAALLMQTIPGGFSAPSPRVFSLVTGRASYSDINAREILYYWIDHPQRLWEAVYETFAQNIKTVIHVGPQPNIIPATLQRLHDNVEAQTQGSIGMRALAVAVSRPWLKALLPQRTALLRAPQLRQLNLEDWLLEHDPTTL